MAGLLGLLDLGAGALAAQEAGVAASGRNTANVNTDGYSRESVDLESEQAAPLVGGVRSSGMTRAESEILARRERLSDGDGGSADALSQALDGLDSDLAPSGNNLVNAIAALFGGIIDLASAPMDAALRGQVLSAADTLSTTFNQGAVAIDRARSDSDARITGFAKEATALMAEIAAANRAATASRDPVLADKRDAAARKLAGLVGGQARVDPDGKMRFVAGSGAVLVDGDRAATLQTSPDAANDGHVRVEVVDGTHRQDVTTQLDGGRIAGEIAFRDGNAKKAAGDLDALAYGLATQVNAVHRKNAALDGSTGHDFFTPPAAQAGAAKALSVSSALVADPSLLAAAAPGQGPGDNQGALALSALGDQPLAAGGTLTFVDGAIQTLGDVGSAAEAASSANDLSRTRADVLKSARDSLSGVSSEDEMQKLAQFQTAHEAATKFISVVDDLLQNLVTNL